MALLIWVISVVLLSFITLIVTTWLCNITDSSNSLIHNNKYNKYRFIMMPHVTYIIVRW